jgi:hypothetical protein
MARRKAVRPTERGERRAETAAVAAYLTVLRAPKVPARSRANLEKRRAQIEQWIAAESSPIREVELISSGSTSTLSWHRSTRQAASPSSRTSS